MASPGDVGLGGGVVDAGGGVGPEGGDVGDGDEPPPPDAGAVGDGAVLPGAADARAKLVLGPTEPTVSSL